MINIYGLITCPRCKTGREDATPNDEYIPEICLDCQMDIANKKVITVMSKSRAKRLKIQRAKK